LPVFDIFIKVVKGNQAGMELGVPQGKVVAGAPIGAENLALCLIELIHGDGVVQDLLQGFLCFRIRVSMDFLRQKGVPVTEAGEKVVKPRKLQIHAGKKEAVPKAESRFFGGHGLFGAALRPAYVVLV
jgi:hypothetical protein